MCRCPKCRGYSDSDQALIFANLEWFGREGAEALEYWLDVSRFSGWKPEQTVEIPWNDAVFRDDLGTYARRGIRHVTTFAAWLDGDYARRWGVAPVRAYGAGLGRWKWIGGEAKEEPRKVSSCVSPDWSALLW